MRPEATRSDAHDRAEDFTATDTDADEVRAWEEIEPGRFLPRRTRGSFRGGKLG